MRGSTAVVLVYVSNGINSENFVNTLHFRNPCLFLEITVTRIVKNKLFQTISFHESNELKLWSGFKNI